MYSRAANRATSLYVADQGTAVHAHVHVHIVHAQYVHVHVHVLYAVCCDMCLYWTPANALPLTQQHRQPVLTDQHASKRSKRCR